MKVLFQTVNYQKKSNKNQNVALQKQSSANFGVENCHKIPFTSVKNFPANLYFVRMSTYKTNHAWHDKMCKATQIISSMMQNNVDIKKIIHMAEHCIKTINRSGIVKDMFGIRKKNIYRKKKLYLFLQVHGKEIALIRVSFFQISNVL